MKLPVRHSVGVAAAALAALVATAVPVGTAAASEAGALIHRTSCTERAFLTIHNNNGRDLLCFANAGFMPVAIYGVNWVESGNNVVTLEYQKDAGNSRIDTVTLQKWTAWNPGHVHRVMSIRIH
ncbi:beta/gamma crystallin domain-containing protein [Streptomyces sp. SCSIO 75703]|uniref:beta/gamma crystallin domain-containing protein n=1 Tax=unclassified Streptomyces TaxID=2593676 RepID=UPI0004BFFA00|nr:MULTISPECIES: beta/gamma crystallin domain-containing protein [unclassified Streptomyces]